MKATHPFAAWLTLVLVYLPATVQAQFTYLTNNGAIIITGYTGSGGSVVIPDSTNGWPITTIADSVFYNQNGVTSVTIPDSITTIGQYAFSSCGLTNVTVPDSITSLEDWTFFADPSLVGITLPNTLVSIGQNVFQGCPLGSVTIPNGVTSIGNNAFYECGSLTNVVIPNSVTSIGGSTFDGCTSLASVTLGNGLTTIEAYTFSECGSLTTIVIPGSVTSIQGDAFESSALQSVYFKGNAPVINSEAFQFENPTLYYLPGTTNWGSSIYGLPVKLWNPSIQTTGGGFGVQNNQFGFTIAGTANIPIAVEASANLPAATWTPLQTCTLTNGSIYFSDPAWSNYPGRFYRISSP